MSRATGRSHLEATQRRWELGRAEDAGQGFLELLEMAERHEDAATVRGIVDSFWAIRRIDGSSSSIPSQDEAPS